MRTRAGFIGHVLVVAALVAAGTAGGASPATAAPPANDAKANAVRLAVPDTMRTYRQSMLEATSNPATDDPPDNYSDGTTPDCIDDNSVWFKIRPATETLVAFDTYGSSFNPQLAVYTRDPARGTKNLQVCSEGDLEPGANVWRLEGGVTAWVIISKLPSVPIGTGKLVLTVSRVVEPVEGGTVITSTRVDATGRVRLRGRTWCTNLYNLRGVGVVANMSQPVDGSPFNAREFEVPCSPAGIAWERWAASRTSGVPFRPGPLNVYLLSSGGYVGWGGFYERYTATFTLSLL
jgi:hypothetical protein